MRSALLVVCSVVAGCGSVGPSGGDAGPPDAPIDAPTFRGGGMVSGCAGSGFVRRLNGANDLTITGDGAFGFPVNLADGASYTVSIASLPTCPQRFCMINNPAGTISSANASVTVSCTIPR